jgi:hypothetical protein
VDAAHKETGGEFTGVLSTHAIGDGQDQVGGVEEDLSGIFEVKCFLRIDGESEEGIVIGSVIFPLLREG